MIRPHLPRHDRSAEPLLPRKDARRGLRAPTHRALPPQRRRLFLPLVPHVARRCSRPHPDPDVVLVLQRNNRVTEIVVRHPAKLIQTEIQGPPDFERRAVKGTYSHTANLVDSLSLISEP